MGCSRFRFEQWVEGKGVLVKTQGVFDTFICAIGQTAFFHFLIQDGFDLNSQPPWTQARNSRMFSRKRTKQAGAISAIVPAKFYVYRLHEIGQQLILRFLPMGVDIDVFLCYDKTVQKRGTAFSV